MAPPAVKKQKISQNSPIIFTSLRKDVDTRLYVFNQEYHVCSEPLRMSSAFFEKAFDPTNGIELASTSPSFTSDWYTIPDKDVGWVLTSSSLYNKDEGHAAFKGKRSQEQKAFNNILCAIYNREYKISSAAELISMVTQAEYYGALPVVSNSLTGPFYTSSGLFSLDTNVATLLESAFKLRHKALFRECFIHVLGPWSKPRYITLSNQILFQMAEAAHKRTEQHIMKIHMNMLQLAANWPLSYDPDAEEVSAIPKGTEHIQHLVGLVPKCLNDEGKIILPKFLRSCFGAAARKHPEAHEEIKKLLEPIMLNRLVLMKDAVSGDGDFEDYFLHFNVQDRMLPWDVNEVTW